MSKVGNLIVISCDQQLHSQTCNYWYLVQSHASAYCAFTHREAFLKWLDELGLSLAGDLPPHGTHGWVHIAGEFSRRMHLSYDAFFALPAVLETETLCNAEYTLGRITVDEAGHRTLHTLNPNCRHRPVFPYAETRARRC